MFVECSCLTCMYCNYLTDPDFIPVCLVLPDWWLMHLSGKPNLQWQQSGNLQIYAGLAGAAFCMSLVRALLFYNTTLNSSKVFHERILNSVLKAPVLFLDTNPVGRVLNRFSTDLAFVDELFPATLLNATQLILFCVSAVVLPSVLNPWVLPVLLPLIAVFVLIAKYYVKTSRELRRLEALNRSPVFSHLATTLDGLVTIRAYGKEPMFMEKPYR